MYNSLHDLLRDEFSSVPGVKQDDTLNVRTLAAFLEVHPYTVWRWLKRGLPWKGAVTIINASEGRLTRNDLFPFLAG